MIRFRVTMPMPMGGPQAKPSMSVMTVEADGAIIEEGNLIFLRRSKDPVDGKPVQVISCAFSRGFWARFSEEEQEAPPPAADRSPGGLLLVPRSVR